MLRKFNESFGIDRSRWLDEVGRSLSKDHVAGQRGVYQRPYPVSGCFGIGNDTIDGWFIAVANRRAGGVGQELLSEPAGD